MADRVEDAAQSAIAHLAEMLRTHPDEREAWVQEETARELIRIRYEITAIRQLLEKRQG